jgi:hypothetical protein
LLSHCDNDPKHYRGERQTQTGFSAQRRSVKERTNEKDFIAGIRAFNSHGFRSSDGGTDHDQDSRNSGDQKIEARAAETSGTTQAGNPTTTIIAGQPRQPATDEAGDGQPARQEAKAPSLLGYFVGEINKAKQQVDEYNPGGKPYLVGAVEAEYLLYAVSPRAREKYSEQMKMTEWRGANPGNKYDASLDALAASAATKLPAYRPNAAAFRFRDPVAEKLLMDYFKNAATIKVHRIGLDTAGWQIQKDNYGVLPAYRYKTAYAYVRDSSDDHQYCRVISATIKQDYAGGGTYSAETYRSSAKEDLFGCP